MRRNNRIAAADQCINLAGVTMADDPLSPQGKIATILGNVEMALATMPQPERQVDWLAWLIERLEVRRRSIEEQERRKTPPPRRISTTSLARAQTEAHNPRELLEQAREADLEHRDTPVAAAPVETTRRHPNDDR